MHYVMHQTSAYVNACYAISMALHFWLISGSGPAETAGIRHFHSESDAKTVQVQLDRNPPLSFRLSLDPEHPYLDSRLSAALIQHFELGYCDRGLMKGRIAIPIHDAEGELVAYAGRWADDDVPGDVEKYLLPPKFRKTLVLFNLSRLVRPLEHVVVVEGYFGAMRLHGLGVPTVALMGSSIADEQVALLREAGVRRISLMLDGDDPGRAAARSMLPSLARSFFVGLCVLPEDEQPDTVDEALLFELVEPMSR